MGALRGLLLVLLLNIAHTAMAAVPAQHSANSAAQLGRVDLKIPDKPQYANLIAEKQLAHIVFGYDPDMRPFTGPDVSATMLSGDCRLTVVLLYLRNSRDIPLKLRRHEIALAFHSFP